ncbi:hypothetical protein ACLBKT_07490 [Erythrobacter sp. W302b]|uniref:hypothetical protein n=1 Tax=Erythrobacter sp. W302b TaxID=3389874 RepID=UPI00396B008C
MDTVKIERESDRIVLSFRREVGDIRKVRYLRLEEASSLGLLMAADAPEHAINLDVSSDVSVQIINAPYKMAFLSLADLRGGRTFIACVEGKTVKQIGQRLLRLGQARFRSAKAGRAFVRRVSHCYMEDADVE